MKKKQKKLIITGILSGVLLSHSLSADGDAKNPNNPIILNDEFHELTEEELLTQLDENGKKLYQSLDAEGKKLALEVASMRCNGTNKCKGLNACETPDNKCAGKGACKGKGKCAFGNKNDAVKAVAKKMAEKRARSTEN